MTDLVWPVAYTLFAWWFSTGIILYLDGLPRRTFAWTLQGATLVMLAGLWALVHTRNDTSVSGAYCSFTCALLVWAWQEVGFLLGVLTGPRRIACPPGARGWERTGYAVMAVLYHELVLVALAVVVLLCVGDGANRVGLWTYLALWGMRQSAKLNIFLGVRNLGESFLPEHLAYLKSYFRCRPMNWLFPFSVTVATGAAAVAWWNLSEATDPFRITGLALVGTMLALGALEHWLLVLPIPSDVLWRWGLRSRRTAAPAAAKADPAGPAASRLV